MTDQSAARRDFLASGSMPLALTPSQNAFEAVGFRFGTPVDSAFQRCDLPAGWFLQPSKSDPTLSFAVDDDGFTRVNILIVAGSDVIPEARAEFIG